MKIQLSYDSPDIRSGYLVLEHLADHSTDLKRTKSDITFITPYVQDGEADEILALECLTWFPGHAILPMLDHWLAKLAIGGIITVSDVDCIKTSAALAIGELSFNDYNVLTHGPQNQPWLVRKCSLSLQQMIEYFESREFKILTKKISDYKFVITAKRTK